MSIPDFGEKSAEFGEISIPDSNKSSVALVIGCVQTPFIDHRLMVAAQRWAMYTLTKMAICRADQAPINDVKNINSFLGGKSYLRNEVCSSRARHGLMNISISSNNPERIRSNEQQFGETFQNLARGTLLYNSNLPRVRDSENYPNYCCVPIKSTPSRRPQIRSVSYLGIHPKTTTKCC